MTELINISIQTFSGSLDFSVQENRPIFVLGRNGVGKSALVQRIVTIVGGKAIYIPGSRPIYFDNDSLSMTPSSRKAYEVNAFSWDSSSDARVKPIAGTQRNEKAIFDLQNAEIQFKVDAANQISARTGARRAVTRLRSQSSPLDKANRLLLQANLTVSAMIANGELVVSRGGSAPYSIAQMSDGERNALNIIAEVLTAPAGSICVIDEPELHLHRSIVVPLIKGVLNERPDCGFVVSTHELDLPNESKNARIALVRACDWEGRNATRWDIDLIDEPQEIPDDIRLDVLGSRRRILFVEGENTSLDQPLYALLYPELSVRCRRSSKEVRQAVVGLFATRSLHHTDAYGLVDGDGYSSEYVARLERDSVFALGVFSVESIYYARPIREAVATKQAEILERDGREIMQEADAAAMRALASLRVQKHLAARMAEKMLREAIVSALPTRKEIEGAKETSIQLELVSPFQECLKKLQEYVSGGDVDAIVSKYPVRSSTALRAISVALGFENSTQYEAAALACISASPQAREAVRGLLGRLNAALAA